ncbi:MerR family transcriptional regulator [Pararhodobacter sp. SW119]|uniref:MerR family transcriptional regulator n=1 Tax=Pararhodobacter sp. SW119 TaxID=2780075 RepID=UPI001AE023F2|nr:MerR family transcriptional regulator [Pararhodobacter sp. SW119]
MKKAPEAFRTISEVSEILDTPAHVLRFWESKFYQVRPVKRAGGRRYYRPDDLALIAGIKHLLQDRGITIRGVQKIMQEEGVRHVIGLGRSTRKLGVEEEANTGEVETAEATAAPKPSLVQRPSTSPDPAPATDGAEARTEPPPQRGARSLPAASQVSPAEAASDEAPAEDTSPTSSPSTPVAASGPSTARRPLPPLPDLSPDPDPEGPRLAESLRKLPEDSAARAAMAPIAQRLDRLLDRMAEVSGTRRW